MKNIFAFLLLLTVFAANADECSCGSYQEGTYNYTVIANTGGCCRGQSNEDASFSTWTPGPGRTWVLVSFKVVKSSVAIAACCPDA